MADDTCAALKLIVLVKLFICFQNSFQTELNNITIKSGCQEKTSDQRYRKSEFNSLIRGFDFDFVFSGVYFICGRIERMRCLLWGQTVICAVVVLVCTRKCVGGGRCNASGISIKTTVRSLVYAWSRIFDAPFRNEQIFLAHGQNYNSCGFFDIALGICQAARRFECSVLYYVIGYLSSIFLTNR